jgi:hypothetical protein
MGGDVAGGCVTWDDPFRDALEPLLARFRDTAERRRSLFILKCVRLSPSLEVCEALMRGERVKRSRLDVDWAREYQL